MGAKLFIQPRQGDSFEVAIGNTATIGRTRENTVCLNFSPLVSRQHAIIRCHNGWQYQLIDLGSRNGTFMNEQRVVMPVSLEHGCQIRVADNLLTFIEDNGPGCDEHQQLTVADTVGTTEMEARPVALLVCDIRGFSAMSERVASGDIAQTLGIWFREVGNLVAKRGGIIDKFIGDAVLAYWGGPGGGLADCTSALETSRELLVLARNQKWLGDQPFQVAVALHYGRVTCSNVGVAAERDATVIGDAVNTVFRLEAVAKEMNETVVLSADFVQQLAPATLLRDFGERALKGKSHMVRIFGLGT